MQQECFVGCLNEASVCLRWFSTCYHGEIHHFWLTIWKIYSFTFPSIYWSKHPSRPGLLHQTSSMEGFIGSCRLCTGLNHRILDSGTRGGSFRRCVFSQKVGPKVTRYKWSHRVPLNKWPKKKERVSLELISPIEVKLCCSPFNYPFFKLNQSINQRQRIDLFVPF